MTIQRVRIDEATQVGEARRQAAAMATGLGFDETAVGRVSIVAAELATNMLRYGGGGEMLLDRVELAGAAFVQILALDRGAGIADIETCLEDGYSTSASSGTGLGAVKRQSALFEIHSQIGKGTAVLSQVAENKRAGSTSLDADVGGVAVPLAGELVCGDGWAVAGGERGKVILLADGLGHGPGASQASQDAVSIFLDRSEEEPNEIALAIHHGLRSTRGAAIGILALDFDRKVADYCGIGNIESCLLGSERKRMVSEIGTAGAVARRMRTYSYPLADHGLAVLNTDGISSHWSLDGYRDLAGCHPALVAGVLYRDFARGSDDASVVVVRLDPR